jgi:cytochrome c oxidase cbb3-type subunit I/II
MTFGMIYWLLPRLYQTDLYSKKLAEWHFWIGTIAILLYIIPIYIAGITQGLMWRELTPKGDLANTFMDTVPVLIPFWWARVFAGVLYVLGIVLLAYNAIRTWMARPKTYDVPVYSTPRLSRGYVEHVQDSSPLSGVPVLDLATKIDRLNRMNWHRAWEHLPVKFTVMTTLAVVVASAFELVPMFLIRSNIPTINTVKPYTPLEIAGRDIYVSEGCYNCHSQMIRPMVAEKLLYGEYSKPGESVYDHPFQWGSRRIGPDLARIGITQQSGFWHWKHFWSCQLSGVFSWHCVPWQVWKWRGSKCSRPAGKVLVLQPLVALQKKWKRQRAFTWVRGWYRNQPSRSLLRVRMVSPRYPGSLFLCC